MKLAEITGEFTFGLVTLLDEETRMELLDFASSPALFTSGTGVLVVKVLHGQEGKARSARVGFGARRYWAG